MQVGGYFLSLNLFYSKIWSQILTIIGLTKVEQWGATKRAKVGTLLVFQWLKLHTPNAGGSDSIPGQGSSMPHSAAKKKKKSSSTQWNTIKKEKSELYKAMQKSGWILNTHN